MGNICTAVPPIEHHNPVERTPKPLEIVPKSNPQNYLSKENSNPSLGVESGENRNNNSNSSQNASNNALTPTGENNINIKPRKMSSSSEQQQLSIASGNTPTDTNQEIDILASYSSVKSFHKKIGSFCFFFHDSLTEIKIKIKRNV